MNADPTRRDFGKAVAATLCWGATTTASPLLMAATFDEKPAVLGRQAGAHYAHHYTLGPFTAAPKSTA